MFAGAHPAYSFHVGESAERQGWLKGKEPLGCLMAPGRDEVVAVEFDGFVFDCSENLQVVCGMEYYWTQPDLSGIGDFLDKLVG